MQPGIIKPMQMYLTDEGFDFRPSSLLIRFGKIRKGYKEHYGVRNRG